MNSGIPLHDKVYIVLGAFALVVAALTVVVQWDAWRERMLMGRHEQPRDTILRRAAARICQALWPADYDEDAPWCASPGCDAGSAPHPRQAACPGGDHPDYVGFYPDDPLTDDNGEPIGDLLPDVPRPSPEPVKEAGPGHLHDGDLAGLDPEDAETVAQWRDDRDQLTEDDRWPGGQVRDEGSARSPVDAPALGAPRPPENSPGPAAASNGTNSPVVPGPGVITATKVGGTWLPLTGQPSPRLDDTAYDLVWGPRAGRPAWRHAVHAQPLPGWVQAILEAPDVDAYMVGWQRWRPRALAVGAA